MGGVFAEAEGLENDLGHLQPVAKDIAAFSEQLLTILDQLDWVPRKNEASYSIEALANLALMQRVG